MTWRATVLTILPEMFPGPLAASLCGRALDAGTWALDTVNIRDFATDSHRTVDDQPYGGGPGMVMRPDVLDGALGASVDGGTVDGRRGIIYLTPRGWPLTQKRVRALADGPGVVLACGRYEGVDQRVLDAWEVEEISLGDYILAGGELAAMALLDACVRLLPGGWCTTPSPWTTRASRPGCWNTRTTRGRRCGKIEPAKAGRCRRF